MSWAWPRVTMTTEAFFDSAIRLVRTGKLDERVLDAAVRNILRVKFVFKKRIGIPFVSFNKGFEIIGIPSLYILLDQRIISVLFPMFFQQISPPFLLHIYITVVPRVFFPKK